MAVFKCKMCGGTLEISNETVATCEYCGTQQTLPKLDTEKKVQLYDRANHFRRNNEFDKAMGIYEMILSEDREDSESYWGIVLCRYGIEYVEDPRTRRRVPTVNRTQFTPIYDDEDYKNAIKFADGYQKDVYQSEANIIDRIHKGILEISQKEEPFDVFICYKETDYAGNRTQDSVYAQDIYKALTKEGYKVFFSRITLEDKLGSAYEPYIFAALNSAKVMLVVGTDKDHFNAVWVKNEWSRYLSLIKDGKDKVLIPVYKDISPYDMPEELQYLQSQDMSKIGFMQDLVRGVQKIIDANSTVRETIVVNSASAQIEPMLTRVFSFLEEGDFSHADVFCEQVLTTDPNNARAYLGKIMAEVKAKRQEDLAKSKKLFTKSKNYAKLLECADDSLKKTLANLEKRAKARLRAKRTALATFLVSIPVSIVLIYLSVTVFVPKMKFKDVVSVYAAYDHTIGIKSDGSVVTAGLLAYGKDGIKNWTDIVEIHEGWAHVIGLKKDGTVVVVGEGNDYGQCNVSDWTNIKAIYQGNSFTIGLKENGTVVVTGTDTSTPDYEIGELGWLTEVQVWKDIVHISVSQDHVVGLKSDGTVVAVGQNEHGQCNVSNWTNICKVFATGTDTIGLKKDGTLVSTYNQYQTQLYDKYGKDYEETKYNGWNDIVDIVVGAGFDGMDNSDVFGIKSDGTVVFEGQNDVGEGDVENWTNIVAIKSDYNNTFGIKSDGTVLVSGKSKEERHEVDGWTDIESIAFSSGRHTVGLKSDGTLVAVGKNSHGQCNVG